MVLQLIGLHNQTLIISSSDVPIVICSTGTVLLNAGIVVRRRLGTHHNPTSLLSLQGPRCTALIIYSAVMELL